MEWKLYIRDLHGTREAEDFFIWQWKAYWKDDWGRDTRPYGKRYGGFRSIYRSDQGRDGHRNWPREKIQKGLGTQWWAYRTNQFLLYVDLLKSQAFERLQAQFRKGNRIRGRSSWRPPTTDEQPWIPRVGNLRARILAIADRDRNPHGKNDKFRWNARSEQCLQKSGWASLAAISKLSERSGSIPDLASLLVHVLYWSRGPVLSRPRG